MKSEPLKCTIVKGALSFYNDGVLSLSFSGRYHERVIEEIKKRKFTISSPLEITIDNVNTSKSVKQNSTFHDLWGIYWKSGMCSDLSKTKLRNRLKYEHGITEFFEYDSKVIATLKSISEYTLKESRNLIQGTIDEMLMVGVNDKRFQEMVKMWNDYTKDGRK